MVVYEDSPGVWKIDQISGPGNAEVPASVQEAAWAVVRSIDDALILDPELRARVDEARLRQPKDSEFTCEIDF